MMKKKPEIQLRDFFIESHFPRDVANDFKDLLIFCTGGKRLSKEKDRKFRDKLILTKKNKININDPDSGAEWIMLGLYYQGIIPDFPQEAMQSAKKNFPLVRKINTKSDGKKRKANKK